MVAISRHITNHKLARCPASFITVQNKILREIFVFFHVQKLLNKIVPDKPDPVAANILQEGLGRQLGEMRTMMQYLFQSFNFRGKAKLFLDST